MRSDHVSMLARPVQPHSRPGVGSFWFVRFFEVNGSYAAVLLEAGIDATMKAF